ncbi:MAG TPA: hypothetical protein VLV82_08125 [Candidatus Angelobacter sp.]|nr:hypothetical protein [Candidatus Angelobacter sp.]
MPRRSQTGRITVPLLAAASTALLVAGCAASPSATSAVSSRSSTTAAPVTSPTTVSPAASTPAPATSTDTMVNAAKGPGLVPPAGYAWSASPGSAAVQVATLPGGGTSLLWMDPTRVRFRYVPGYRYPEGSPASAADRSPSTWVPRMLAAFNSGYKLSDHVGGYYYLGRTVVPLRAGLASLVVHRNGTLAVGVWGQDIGMTPDTLLVRQNMRPLVVGGVSQASASDGPRTWGISNGNRALANRSALGRLGDGSFVFVYAHNVTAATLGATLVSLGVREAIMLDMNISWPTGFVYAHTGSQVVGARINHWIVRPPSTYLTRFKKDFIAVEGI